jgi:hypothetical protein
LDAVNVTKGSFFESFFYPVDPPQTSWVGAVDEISGIVWINYTMTDTDHMISLTTVANERGVIAIISLNTTYQGPFFMCLSSNLNLQVDTANGRTSYFRNDLGEELPFEEERNGEVTIRGGLIGRAIDLYDQYPDPFGGQGFYQSSDMFWPQKDVELYANVTYNEWPMTNKLVGFEVRGPHNELVDLLMAVSDYYGVAHTTYHIPWPCDDPEYWFGVWTITATVDVVCIVVHDTLQFHFDYLVHWYGGDPYKVTTDKEEYGHCEYINVNVTFGSHSQMPRWVLLTVSIRDELNYPIGTAAVLIQAGSTTFSQLKNYTQVTRMCVLMRTATGTATIYVNAYIDWPSIGGSPYAPTFAPAPTVNILPSLP